jgi:hypothetical protein
MAALQALTQVTGDVRAVTGDREEISLEKAAVQELADSLRGNLLLPGNEGYDVARRVLNKSIDRYPALIVQPTGVSDIQNAVTFARERRLLLAVKVIAHGVRCRRQLTGRARSRSDGARPRDACRYRFTHRRRRAEHGRRFRAYFTPLRFDARQHQGSGYRHGGR